MLDAIDKALIEHLQTDGRQTASELAQIVGLSVPAVAERIRKLLEQEIITGFHAAVDSKKIGLDVGAHIYLISEHSDHYHDVVQLAREHPEVQQCLSVTGEGSHLLVVRTRDTSSLEKLLGQIQAWPGVKRTETRIIMSQYKERGILRVPDDLIKGSDKK